MVFIIFTLAKALIYASYCVDHISGQYVQMMAILFVTFRAEGLSLVMVSPFLGG